jgi:ribosomal protein S18 acetylase RimI-like enzyme
VRSGLSSSVESYTYDPFVELRAHTAVESFLQAASPLLAADEPRHNLVFGICSTLVAARDTYPVFHLWTVEDDSDVAAAALMTPPFNLLVARPRSPGALEFLARELDDQGFELPGVTGAHSEVDEFAEAWRRRTGVRYSQHGSGQGIYAVSKVEIPSGVPGAMRFAGDGDRGLLVEWMEAFTAEALPDAPHQEVDAFVGRRLEGRPGGLVLWVDPEPVSMAGFGGETPTGVRIGPVYTPPEFRGRGYGSAVTAELSACLLAEGRSQCFLYTELGNPTSNRIYRNIGYEFVCESAVYVFEP